MNISLEIGLLVGSLLIFGSILISKTGYRFGIPTLLMFLVAGMLFGTDGVGIQFDNATQAQYIGTIALSIILFSGGMDTKLSDIRPVALPGIMLSTVGVLLTTTLTGLFIYLISGWQHTTHRNRLQPAGFVAVGRHHVVHRLGIGVQHPAHATHQPAP